MGSQGCFNGIVKVPGQGPFSYRLERGRICNALSLHRDIFRTEPLKNWFQEWVCDPSGRGGAERITFILHPWKGEALKNKIHFFLKKYRLHLL